MVYPIHATTETIAPTAAIMVILISKMSHCVAKIKYRYIINPIMDMPNIDRPVTLVRRGLVFMKVYFVFN